MRILCSTLICSIFASSAYAIDPPALSVAKKSGAIVVKAGDQIVTKYHHGESVAKPYFWPLHAPDGTPVTRDWPMVMIKKDGSETTDHVHQKSVWFCHGDIIPEGIELKKRSVDKKVKGVDFWSEAANHGRIVCVNVGDVKQIAPTHVSLSTTNEWRTPDGVKILDETRVIHFHSLANGYLIELDIDLNASVCPITFGDTKEGSLGVRVNDAMRTLQKDGGTVTSADKTAAKAPAKENLVMWGQFADWHDYSGQVNAKSAGLAIFDDPKNAYRAAWHTRAYGLMAANPFGRAHSGFPAQKGKTDLVTLKKGEHLKLHYGVYAHTGDVESGAVAATFEKFKAK